MSKADRNRQTARAKIARMQAAGAQRRRHRNWIAGIGAAVLVILAITGITLAVTSGSSAPATAKGGTPELKLAALSTLGTLQPAPAPGPSGARRRPGTRCRAAGGYRHRCHRRPDRRHQLPGHRAEHLPHPRPPDHLHQRRSPGNPGRYPHPRQLPVLAPHPRRRRHHPHRVPGPPHLHPGQVLRRMGPATRPGQDRPRHRARHRPIQRQGLPGQPPRHPPQRTRPDPARNRHPPHRPGNNHLPQRLVTVPEPDHIPARAEEIRRTPLARRASDA